MKFTPRLAYQGVILLSVPLLFEITLVLVLSAMLQQAEREVKREVCARSILTHVRALTNCLTGGAAIGYNTIAGQVFLERYRAAIKPLPDELRSLEDMGGYEPDQLRTFRLFRNMIEKLDRESADGQRMLKAGDIAGGTARLDALTPLLADIWLGSEALSKEVRRIEEQNPAIQSQTRERVQNILYASLGLNVILALLLSAYFYRGTVSRLARVMASARAIGQKEPLTSPLSGDDEIASLDRALHTAAAALAEASKRERAIIENAVDVICTIDADGCFVDVSRASLRLWGYSPDSLVGRSALELVVLEDIERTKKAVAESMTTTASVNFENRIRTASGTALHTRWSVQWSESERRLFCIAHDISDRKRTEESLRESEARVRLIVDKMPVGLIIIDDAGKIEMANPVIQRLFGHATRDLVGQDLQMLFPAGATIDFFKVGRDTTAGVPQSEERDVLTKEGTRVPVEFSLSEFQSAQGRRFLATFIDITERRQIEQMKQDFVNMVSHDLRTPLSSIQTFLALLMEGVYSSLSEDGMQKAAAADRSASRLIMLVNDLLDIEKMEAGRLDLHMKSVPIARVVSRSIDAVRDLAERRGIRIEVSTQEQAVMADEDRVVQVLVNLLGNAIKFSPAKGAVELSTQTMPDFITVTVADRGPGVAPEHRSLVFERFRQVPARDGERSVGSSSGLGLTISRLIVEQHGGAIGVDGRDGGGSIFWFRLKRAKDIS